MANPAYSVLVVLGIPGNPVYSTTHGDPNPEPPADTILCDPLTYKWGFEDGVIPNPLEPSTVSFDLWSTSRSVAPEVKRGAVVNVRVHAGALTDARIVDGWFRVTEVTNDLVPNSPYPYRQTITGADFLADLGGWFPGPQTAAVGGGVGGFRQRLTWTGRWGGFSVGTPTWWPDLPSGPPSLRFGLEWLGSAAGSLFALVLRSYAPNGVHHAVTPYLGVGYPAGYEYCDSRPDRSGSIIGWTPFPDVNSGLRYMVQPAGRKLLSATPLPLRFAAQGSLLVLAARPSSVANRQPAVSADVCVLPTSQRQGREHAPNVIRATGFNSNLDPAGDKENLEYATTHQVQSADAQATGARGRELDTMLVFGVYSGDKEGPVSPIPLASAEVATYLADASQLAEVWTFDGFTIKANSMTAADAAAILPVLTPAYLDSSRDGQLVRHITVHSIDEQVRPNATRSTASGFIVSGQLSIRDGELEFTITTAPGDPSPAPAGTPITVGEFKAATYGDLLVPDVHPNITIADLSSVDA